MEDISVLVPVDILLDSYSEEGEDTDSFITHKYSKATFELLRSAQAKKTIADVHFCNIYYEAIKELLNLNDVENSARFRRYLAFFDDFADDWCRFTKTNIAAYDDMVDTLMDSLYYRVVYVYRNALLLSSAVSLHFGAVLFENHDVAQRLLQKKTLRVCSVGGGSASDVVAIVSVLETMSKDTDLDIRVTVVDSDGRWKNTCLAVLRTMRQFRWATWKIGFVQSDLSEKNLNSEALKAIKNADVVTMVKFISEFQRGNKDLQATLKNITEIISPESILLVLDAAESDFIKACGSHTGQMDNHQLIYEDICYLHTLELDAIKKILLFYQKFFSALQCNTNQDLFVRIWLKTCPKRPKISERQLQVCFRRNLDQYNLEETFLDRRFSQNWKQQFSEDMRRMGWSKYGVACVFFKKKLVMDEYQMALVDSKMEMDSLIEKLEVEEGASKRNVGTRARKIVGQFTEEEWESYFDSKGDFAMDKQEVYRLTVLSLYNHMTRTLDFN